MAELTSALEAILFASGESIPAARLSLVLGASEDEVFRSAEELAQSYESGHRGIRLLRLEDKLQLCSAPEYAPYITKALEQRKPAMLSQSALETLAIVAYFQPVTRAYIDQIRGVDSSYTVSTLLERGLIEAAGRLDVPGRRRRRGAAAPDRGAAEQRQRSDQLGRFRRYRRSKRRGGMTIDLCACSAHHS